MPTPSKEALERAEGNPLFVEETIRMLVESGSGNGSSDRIPDTLQALIAARIDHLPPAARRFSSARSVVGRVFWKGALEHLSPDVEDIEALLEDLQQREFVLREPRSSISGEPAYRFKHLLIREVAYTGLAKLARAQYHARFAEWLAERTGEELARDSRLPPRSGRRVPHRARGRGSRGSRAGDRRRAREGGEASDRPRGVHDCAPLGLRALELRPTLGARYVAARAAWRLQDWAAVEVEMAKVRDQAHEQEEPVIEALALTALGEAVLKRHGDWPRRRRSSTRRSSSWRKGRPGARTSTR